MTPTGRDSTPRTSASRPGRAPGTTARADGTDRIGALLVLNYDVHDWDRLQRYREAATEVLRDLGAVLVTSSSASPVGEVSAAGSTTVILGFASHEAAEQAYTSPEYQAVVGERLAATTPRAAFIVDVTNPGLWASGDF